MSAQAVDFDAIVVGAGVVGLAIARALAQSGRSVAVLETEGVIGTRTSSRNSEVIHAGLYYPTGSLKARLCVEGRRRLYEFCVKRDVGYAKCGKLVVASDESELAAIEALIRMGEDNGVEGLQIFVRSMTSVLVLKHRGYKSIFIEKPSSGGLGISPLNSSQSEKSGLIGLVMMKPPCGHFHNASCQS